MCEILRIEIPLDALYNVGRPPQNTLPTATYSTPITVLYIYKGNSI